MTYFEAVGVDYQYSAKNIDEAKRKFEKSCYKCSTQGKCITCDRCAIANAYYNIIGIFRR
jgi:hypothetical protein